MILSTTLPPTPPDLVEDARAKQAAYEAHRRLYRELNPHRTQDEDEDK